MQGGANASPISLEANSDDPQRQWRRRRSKPVDIEHFKRRRNSIADDPPYPPANDDCTDKDAPSKSPSSSDASPNNAPSSPFSPDVPRPKTSISMVNYHLHTRVSSLFSSGHDVPYALNELVLHSSGVCPLGTVLLQIV
ncbi:hypothetical protein GYMLUDRAFT_248712 [Collybiopsis luxurians FD-317 M1]|uniref:Uncharacterized protein n=1 Tax=Collybiopsis luxurians FD-317 M1 TaxID=944289 RepID=A0A0D0CKA0_9AGAR|nr:hypothetical protein GYMLUDRAFT_248712 [Collybiopsis luxurians FD-317 M1]